MSILLSEYQCAIIVQNKDLKIFCTKSLPIQIDGSVALIMSLDNVNDNDGILIIDDLIHNIYKK